MVSVYRDMLKILLFLLSFILLNCGKIYLPHLILSFDVCILCVTFPLLELFSTFAIAYQFSYGRHYGEFSCVHQACWSLYGQEFTDNGPMEIDTGRRRMKLQ